MKAVRVNRTIHLSDVPSQHAPEFSICVNYTTTEGPAVLDKAVTLDGLIMPLIVTALNTEETAPTNQHANNNTKARFWAMAFADKISAVEHAYHAWQHVHVLPLTSQERKAAPELRQLWNMARAELYAWVVAHPAPEGADKLI